MNNAKDLNLNISMFNYKKMFFTMIHSIFFWHSGNIGGYIGHCLGDARRPKS